MAVCQGSFGRITWGSDFTAYYSDVAWGTGGLVAGEGIGDGLGFASVNEGSFASTVDEANGVLAITTDTGDNDNAALYAGVFQPSVNGDIWMEARFKVDAVTTTAIFFGLTETFSNATPVMPAEFATATMTYNGTGQIVGVNFDSDGTTDDFRAVFGDAGAVQSNADANGTRANQTITADEWYLARVELSPDGVGKVYVGHDDKSMELVKEVTGCPTTNLLHSVLMVENRDGSANVMEVDYFVGGCHRDWEVT